MKVPFKKSMDSIPVEGAHGGSGRRQLLLAPANEIISSNIEAVTKGFLDPGGVFDWHQHIDVDEFFIVLLGEGVIEYEDGTKFDYAPGDVIYNPANQKHRIEASGGVESVYFFIRVRV